MPQVGVVVNLCANKGVNRTTTIINKKNVIVEMSNRASVWQNITCAIVNQFICSGCHDVCFSVPHMEDPANIHHNPTRATKNSGTRKINFSGRIPPPR